MADVLQMTVSGLAEAERALNDLAADMRRKVVLGALRDAARPVLLAARRFAPVLRTDSKTRVAGTVRRNVKTFNSKKYKGQGGLLGVYVSVRASRKDLRNAPISGDPYYWRWLEGGHKIVPRSRRVGARAGKAVNAKTLRARRQAATASVKPYPFLGPAFEAQGQAALRIFEQRIFERIAKANAAK